MKLTDEEILDALKAGKFIENNLGDIYRQDCTGMLQRLSKEHEWLTLHTVDDRLLKSQFEIIDSLTDWDKVIKEHYLCKFWNGKKEPYITEGADVVDVGLLYEYPTCGGEYFWTLAGNNWEHCRPLKPGEICIMSREEELLK